MLKEKVVNQKLKIGLGILGVFVLASIIFFVAENYNNSRQEDFNKLLAEEQRVLETPVYDPIYIETQDHKSRQYALNGPVESSIRDYAPIEIKNKIPVARTNNLDEKLIVDWYELERGTNYIEYMVAIQQKSKQNLNLWFDLFIDNANYEAKNTKLEVKSYKGQSVVNYTKDSIESQKVEYDLDMITIPGSESTTNGTSYYLVKIIVPPNAEGRIGFKSNLGAIYHPWFNLSYSFKRQISINGTDTSLNNQTYVLNGTLGYSTKALIDLGLMQSNCNDLIFSNGTETIQLPYIFESRNDVKYGCNTDNTLIWLKTDLVTNDNNTKNYLYYGNIGATDEENKNYEVFEDYGLMYLFGDNSSQVVWNRANSSRNGTVTNDYVLKDDFFGHGFNLTLKNYINVDDINKSSDFTLGFWLKYYDLDKTGADSYLYSSWSNNPIGRHFLIIVNDQALAHYNNQLSLSFVNQSSCSGTSSTINPPLLNLTHGQEYFIVVVFNSTYSWNIYSNGVLNYTFNNYQEICGIGEYTAFGSNLFNTPNPLVNASGTLDNLFTINKSLTAEEIKFLYQQQSIVSGTQLVYSNLSITSSLTPVSATSNDDLTYTFEVNDNDTTKKYNSSVVWSVDGINNFNFTYLNSALVGSAQTSILNSANTSRGQNWTATLFVWSNQEKSNLSNLTRYIGNSAPTVPNILSPFNNSVVPGGVTLTCQNGTDPDGDILTYDFFGDSSNPPVDYIGNSNTGLFYWSNLINSTYYWQCRSNDTVDVSSKTEIRALTVSNLNQCTGANATHAVAYNFSFADEITQQMLENITFDIDYYTYYDDLKANLTNSFTTINQSSVLLCIFPINATFQVQAQIDYVEEPLFDKRSYFLVNDTANNVTQYDILRLLKVAFGTSTTIRVVDESYTPVSNAYVFVERFYTGEGSYKTVGAIQTDDDGEGHIFLHHLVGEYRFKVYVDSEQVFVSDKRKIITAPTGTETLVTLNLGADTTTELITQYESVIYSLEFNNLTRTWELTWLDTDGLLNPGCLEVIDMRNGTQYCHTCSSDQSATLTCSVGTSVPLSSRAIFSDEDSYHVVDIVENEEYEGSPLSSFLGLNVAAFLATLLLMVLGIIGFAGNFMAGLVIIAVGAILLTVTGLFSIPVFSILGVIAVIIFIAFKRNQ